MAEMNPELWQCRDSKDLSLSATDKEGVFTYSTLQDLLRNYYLCQQSWKEVLLLVVLVYLLTYLLCCLLKIPNSECRFGILKIYNELSSLLYEYISLSRITSLHGGAG